MAESGRSAARQRRVATLPTVGDRANYVVVDADGWRLYYSHWGAQIVDRHLAAGPAAAVRFIEAQLPCDPTTGWLDDDWAEGGAMVDPTRRRMLFYGAHDFLADLDYLRAYLALLRRTWPGWDIGWAVDGLGDFTTHLGVDSAVVRSPGRVQSNSTFGGPIGTSGSCRNVVGPSRPHRSMCSAGSTACSAG